LVNFYQTTRCYNPEDSNLRLSVFAITGFYCIGYKSAMHSWTAVWNDTTARCSRHKYNRQLYPPWWWSQKLSPKRNSIHGWSSEKTSLNNAMTHTVPVSGAQLNTALNCAHVWRQSILLTDLILCNSDADRPVHERCPWHDGLSRDVGGGPSLTPFPWKCATRYLPVVDLWNCSIFRNA
jgi:hypothetical protein